MARGRSAPPRRPAVGHPALLGHGRGHPASFCPSFSPAQPCTSWSLTCCRRGTRSSTQGAEPAPFARIAKRTRPRTAASICPAVATRQRRATPSTSCSPRLLKAIPRGIFQRNEKCGGAMLNDPGLAWARAGAAPAFMQVCGSKRKAPCQGPSGFLPPLRACQFQSPQSLQAAAGAKNKRIAHRPEADGSGTPRGAVIKASTNSGERGKEKASLKHLKCVRKSSSSRGVSNKASKVSCCSCLQGLVLQAVQQHRPGAAVAQQAHGP